MPLAGRGSTAIRKTDLSNQRQLGISIKNLCFKHYDSGGNTGINLLSLATPSVAIPEWVNPSGASLAAANLLFNKANLLLTSSIRGRLTVGLDYKISSSTTIVFNGWTSQAGEIFEGIISQAPTTGNLVADVSATPVSGILSAGSIDFTVGYPFVVGKYPGSQIGAVLVYFDGILQLRNPGNGTTGANYYEVAGSVGSGNIIRLTTAFAYDIVVSVIPTMGLAIAPSSSLISQIESIQGQINTLVPYVGDAVGISPPYTILYQSQPTQVDLKAMGDQVYAMRTTWYKTATFTAAVNNRYSVDSSNGIPITITLPATANSMEMMEFEDTRGTWDTYNVSIASNLIQGVSQTYTLNQKRGVVRFRWIDSTFGYQIYKLVP